MLDERFKNMKTPLFRALGAFGDDQYKIMLEIDITEIAQEDLLSDLKYLLEIYKTFDSNIQSILAHNLYDQHLFSFFAKKFDYENYIFLLTMFNILFNRNYLYKTIPGLLNLFLEYSQILCDEICSLEKNEISKILYNYPFLTLDTIFYNEYFLTNDKALKLFAEKTKNIVYQIPNETTPFAFLYSILSNTPEESTLLNEVANFFDDEIERIERYGYTSIEPYVIDLCMQRYSSSKEPRAKYRRYLRTLPEAVYNKLQRFQKIQSRFIKNGGEVRI